MLVEIAIGDAFGAGYEFQKTLADKLEYVQHPKHLLLRPGMYTDDTQMSLGVAEVLAETDDPSMLDFANSWVSAFHRDKRDGYARGFQAFLEATLTGVDFLHKIRPYSERSGAAMRSVPLGVLPTPEKVINVARLQAAITHNTDGGIHSSMTVALASHYLYYKLGHPKELGSFIAKHLHIGMWARRYSEYHDGSPGNNGIQCAHAAIDTYLNNYTMADMVLSAVQMQGDTDTVAAIVGGLAAIDHTISHELPQKLYDDLEDGAYGRTYLAGIDEKLSAKYPRP